MKLRETSGNHRGRAFFERRTLRNHDNLVHGKITNSILNCAYLVHSKLGPGLLEKPYRVCLCHELRRTGLTIETEKLLPIEYDDS